MIFVRYIQRCVPHVIFVYIIIYAQIYQWGILLGPLSLCLLYKIVGANAKKVSLSFTKIAVYQLDQRVNCRFFVFALG